MSLFTIMNLKRLFRHLHLVFFSHASSTGIALLGEQATSLVHTCFMDCSKTYYIQKMNHVDLDDLVLYISSAQLFGFQLNETYFCPVLTNTNYTTILK